MTNNQTQCPSCYNTYPIPEAQINSATAKARCPECQTIFIVNDNIYNPMNSQAIVVKPPVPDTINPQSTSNPIQKKSSDINKNQKKADDILGSLDDMSDWITQQAESMNKPQVTNEEMLESNTRASTESQINAQNPDIIKSKNSDELTMSNINQDLSMSNDIISKKQDLPPLSTDSYETNTPNQQDGLSDLMNNYGVISDNEEATTDEENDRITKMGNRVLKSGPTSQQMAQSTSSLTSLLWLLGCILLILLLVAQYAIFNMNTLVKSPAHNSKLTAVCKILSCSIPNADINSLKVTRVQYYPSKLKSPSSYTDIVATIVNKSNKPQISPNLKVSIQGSQGLIGEFVASPKDYMIVKQVQISEGQLKPFMFTIANNKEITNINIEAFY